MSQLNKPKYTLLKNWGYAMNGLFEVTKNESSFKLQVVAFFALQIVAFLLPIDIGYKVILGLSMFIPIMAELVNSAIERVVDLVTTDYQIMAKYAKDAGAALVFTSIILTSLIWVFTLLIAFKIL
ncbi:MAG: diacylglycerol kinase [Thiovulaceae bacterium]|nr:diacylglycerol kinase [Sulfurimonadaceae bacterium]